MTVEQTIAIRGLRANYPKRAVRVIDRPTIPMTIAHTPDGAWFVHQDGHLTKVVSS